MLTKIRLRQFYDLKAAVCAERNRGAELVMFTRFGFALHKRRVFHTQLRATQ